MIPIEFAKGGRERVNILVSACLLGLSCRYDGSGCYLAELEKLKERHNLIPVCPEVYGGLPTPREPAEIVGGSVLTKSGRDVTVQYQKGAREALLLARRLDCRAALLKYKSPSCGKGRIYDGSFSGRLVDGSGLLARLLTDAGIPVFTEQEIEVLLSLA